MLSVTLEKYKRLSKYICSSSKWHS